MAERSTGAKWRLSAGAAESEADRPRIFAIACGVTRRKHARKCPTRLPFRLRAWRMAAESAAVRPGCAAVAIARLKAQWLSSSLLVATKGKDCSNESQELARAGRKASARVAAAMPRQRCDGEPAPKASRRVMGSDGESDSRAVS